MPFKALWITENANGQFKRSIIERNIDDLPGGEVLVRVHYSSLNYKDAMSATGNRGITKKYPHTPGVDAAGTVELSRSEQFATGDEVLVTGFDLGMNTSGGFAQFIRVPAAWVVMKPHGYTLRDAMIIGTAGFTAALALHKMQLMGQQPDQGPVVVTGASGGVGSLSIALLAKAGYEVIAVTGKSDVNEYLHHLGARRIEERSFVNDTSGKALIRSRWAGAIDTIGGNTLATLLKGCRGEGSVCATGLIASSELITTVYPFILNSVNLLGIGSAETPMDIRLSIWKRLAGDWNIKDKLESIGKEVTLEELDKTCIDAILRGRIIGRTIVKL